jgi:hypothetical protein
LHICFLSHFDGVRLGQPPFQHPAVWHPIRSNSGRLAICYIAMFLMYTNEQ